MRRQASRGTRCETARHQRATFTGHFCEKLTIFSLLGGSPRNLSSHFIDHSGQREVRPDCDVWRASIGGLGRRKNATGFGIRQDTAIHVKDDLIESVNLSSRGSDAKRVFRWLPRKQWPRGLSCPLRARSTSIDRGWKTDVTMMPLSISGDGPFAAHFVSLLKSAPRRNSWSIVQGQDPSVVGERTNADPHRSNPK
jgi:hypothetical protein